jgi:hypothetical protein
MLPSKAFPRYYSVRTEYGDPRLIDLWPESYDLDKLAKELTDDLEWSAAVGRATRRVAELELALSIVPFGSSALEFATHGNTPEAWFNATAYAAIDLGLLLVPAGKGLAESGRISAKSGRMLIRTGVALKLAGATVELATAASELSDTDASNDAAALGRVIGTLLILAGVKSDIELLKPRVLEKFREIAELEITMARARNAARASESAARNRALFEEYKAALRRDMSKPRVVDSELGAMLDELYRPGAKFGSGSTADAARVELAFPGASVAGSHHVQKARNAVPFLDKWLKNNPNARTGDIAAAENVLKDLLDALSTKRVKP